MIGGGYYDQDVSVMTGNKSQAFLKKKNGARSSPTSILRNSTSTGSSKTKHFSPSFIPEYVLDVWKDTRPNNRCSITFLVESGHNKHKELKIRVSTDGNFLVINKKMSSIALSAQKGIKDLIIRKDKTFQNNTQARLLDNHGRIIGRKSSVAVMCNRDSSRNPQVDLEARLPLPFKCRKTFAEKEDGDDLFFGKKFVKFDDQSIWCTCHLISNVNDGYKAMDDIPEEEVINIVEDYIKKPTSSIPLKSNDYYSTQGSFSIGTTAKTFYTSPSSSNTTNPSKQQYGHKSPSLKNENIPNVGKEENTTPQQKNTLEYFLKSASSKIIQNSVFLSPTNKSDGAGSDFFHTPPEINITVPPTVTCSQQTTKVRSEQRKREKDGQRKVLRSGKEYGTALVTTDDDSSIITHTSKAMKLMTLVEHQNDNTSVGTLSMMDEGASTVSSNLRKLNAAENKIDNEINDLAQY